MAVEWKVLEVEKSEPRWWRWRGVLGWAKNLDGLLSLQSLLAFHQGVFSSPLASPRAAVSGPIYNQLPGTRIPWSRNNDLGGSLIELTWAFRVETKPWTVQQGKKNNKINIKIKKLTVSASCMRRGKSKAFESQPTSIRYIVETNRKQQTILIHWLFFSLYFYTYVYHYFFNQNDEFNSAALYNLEYIRVASLSNAIN